MSLLHSTSRYACFFLLIITTIHMGCSDENNSTLLMNCQTYCDLARENCTGDQTLFDDTAACVNACEQYPTNGEVDDTDGDTIQCRVYHLGVAKTDPLTHCIHGSPSGGGICVQKVTRCDQYCATMDEKCPNTYDSLQACQDACFTFAPGTQGETTGDTLECRFSFALDNDPNKSPAQLCEDASDKSTTCVKDTAN